MRSQVISDGLKGLQAEEVLNAEKIIQWIVEALEVTENVPDFTITSAGVASRPLFKHLHSVTAKVVFPFESSVFTKNIHRVAKAVGRVFDATIARDDSLKCWIQIGQFLSDLQQHCKNGLFMVMSGVISVSLLKKMVAVPDFNANQDIIDSMSLYFKCGCAVIHTRNAGSQKQKKIWKYLRTLYTDCIDEFFDLIGENLIFSSNAFAPLTSQILHGGLAQSDALAIRKYLDALLFVLGSNDEAARANMATFLRRQDEKERLLNLIVIMKTQNARILLLKVLRTMLEYSREIDFPFDIDWTAIFVHTLYWHNDAVELLLLEAEDTEDNEETKTCNLIKRVVKIFLRHNDDSDRLPAQYSEEENVKRLALLMRGTVDLVTCEKQFYLLRTHVADSPAMCAVLILFIEYAAKAMAEQSHFRQEYVDLMKTLFRHIEHVKPFPELLSRVLNIFDINIAKDDEVFTKEIISIVPEAFHRCEQYGTAVDLLRVLKAVGYEDAKSLELFEKLLLVDASGVRSKETLVLMLAANDVFDVFKMLNALDQSETFNYFKGRLERCGDEQTPCSVMYASLMVHVLAAIQLTTEPGEALTAVEEEAHAVHQYLSDRIEATEKLSFASVHMGIAICVYQNTFKTYLPGREILLSLLKLGHPSIAFRFNYDRDAKKAAAINDLRLLTKFWQCATAVYQDIVPDNLEPSIIFEIYPRIEIHLVDLAAEFLSTILENNNAVPAERHKLFVETVHRLVQYVVKIKVNPIVTKLLQFVAKKKDDALATSVASMIFIKNLELLDGNFDRPQVVNGVQVNLYKNHMKNNAAHSRRMLMNVLNTQINAREGDAQKHLVELQKSLEKIAPVKESAPNQGDDNEMDHDGASDEEISGGDGLPNREMDDSNHEVTIQLNPVNMSCLQ